MGGNPYTPRAHEPSRTGNPVRDQQQANAARAILRNMGKRPREEDEREGVDASAARNVRSNRSRAASATENLESSDVGLFAMATVATASPPGSDEEGCDENGCDEDEDEPDQEAQVAMYHKSMMEENTSSPGRPKELQYAKEMKRYYEWVADKKRVACKCLTAAEYVLFRYDTASKAEDPLSTGQVNMLLNAVNFALDEARKSETDPEKLAQHDEMKLRAHLHVKSLVANVNKAQGTRKRKKQAPVLQKHKDVLTREMIAKGAYTLCGKTAHRRDTPRAHRARASPTSPPSRPASPKARGDALRGTGSVVLSPPTHHRLGESPGTYGLSLHGIISNSNDRMGGTMATSGQLRSAPPCR